MKEDIELQIELVELQIDHEFLTSYAMGLLAIQFGLIIGFASIYYTVFNRSEFALLSIGLLVTIFGIALSIYRTMERYKRRRKEIKRRIDKLKREHLWLDYRLVDKESRE